MRPDKITLMLLLISCLFNCSQTSWINEDFKAIQDQIDTVSIIFPHIAYYEKDGKDKAFLFGHSIYISKNTADVVKELIDEGNYAAKAANIILDSTVINQWIPQYFLESVKQYQTLKDTFENSRTGTRTFPVTSDLKILVDKVNTEYFLFIQGIAFGTSDETKKVDVEQAQTYELLWDCSFSYDYQWDGIQLWLYLVEKESYEIVWYSHNDKRNTKYHPLKTDQIKQLCLKLFRKPNDQSY